MVHIQNWDKFLKVAEAGSLSRAADQLGVAQPSLSRQIAALELELGLKLFSRHGRGLRLTPAGELLRKRAETILGQIAMVREELAAASDEPAGVLTLGMPPSMTAMLTGPVVAEFVRRYPRVQMHVREGTLITVRQAILSKEIELGVISLPLSDARLAIEPFVQEPMVVVGPAAARLGEPARLTPHDVALLPLILPQRPNSIRLIVEDTLERAGHQANVVMDCDFGPAFDCIANGHGYCVVPSCALSNPALGNRVSAADFDGVTMSWALVHLKDQPLSIAAAKIRAAFVAAAKAAIGDGSWRAEMLID